MREEWEMVLQPAWETALCCYGQGSILCPRGGRGGSMLATLNDHMLLYQAVSSMEAPSLYWITVLD